MGKEGSIIKRTSDIIISLIVLLITSPVLLLAIAAIRIESSGPAIFVQLKAGKNGSDDDILD